MLWTIYEIFLNLFQGFLFSWFISKMLTPSRKKWNFGLYCACSLLTAGALSTYLFFKMPEWDRWIFVFIILYSLFFLEGNLFQKFFWNAILIVLSTGIIIVFYQICSLLLHVDLDTIMAQTSSRIIFTLASNFTLWAILFLLTRLFRNKKESSPSYYLLITDIMCILLIELFLKIYNRQDFSLSALVTGCSVSFIIGVMTIVTHKIISNYAAKEQEYRFREAYLKDIALQREDLQELFNTTQHLRHDMKAYVADIQQMIDAGILKEKPAYLQSMESNLQQSFHTGNNLLDSLLTVKASKIQRNGFEFRGTNLHYTGGLNISDDRLCSLLSNMLDNAYEALTVRKDKPGTHYVYLQFSYGPGGLMIICENPLFGVYPKTQNKTLFSSKPELYHGLGLSIMEQLVQEAGGQFDVIIDQEQELFRILALIPLSSDYETRMDHLREKR